VTLRVGERFEVAARWPYYVYSTREGNGALFVRVVGCRGTAKKIFRTFDGVLYALVDMDLDPGVDYAFDPEWCRSLTPLELLAEQGE
jgi:hypothetical protein